MFQGLRGSELRDILAKREEPSLLAPLKALLGDALHIIDIITDLTLA